ncbi:MAG: DUF2723 domain-containing protein [Polyangiales bacterium]
MTERLLGLPVRSRRGTALATAALLIVYLLTMSRSLSLYDSPELALVAEQLGLGHPFGQPLHTLLGGLLTRVPGIDPLFALNALSAVAGALTVVPATSLAEALLLSPSDTPPADSRFVAPTIALLGLHPALWEPSTRIEVYPLAILLALWAAARFANAVLARNPAPRPYLTTGIALGLAASSNIVCAAGVALAMTPRLLIGVGRRELPRRAIGLIMAGGLCGLMTYAYVFVVAGRQDVVVWGAPTDAKSIEHYFTAADFTYKSVASWSEWWGHVGEVMLWTLRNGVLAILLAGFTGYALYARRRGLGRFFFNFSIVFFVAFVARDGMFAPDVLDQGAYLSVPIWIATAGMGLFIAYLGGRNAWLGMGGLSVVLLFVMLMPPAPHQRTRNLDYFTHDIAVEALQSAPEGAVVIVAKDHWIGPMWYVQEQEHVRPDVVLLAYGLSASEWYWRFLYRRHPALTPIELRAPGGRVARVRRFIHANAERSIQVESVALADLLGLPTCPSPWLLDVRPSCPTEAQEPSLARHAGATLSALGTGSPGTDGLIALMTLDRGHDLYSQGFARAAIGTLLEGVPGTELPNDIDLSSVPTRVRPSLRPHPVYGPRVALGHPAQNLHYAATIANATGAKRLASYFLEWSKALGPVEPKFTTLPASPDNL